MKDDNWGELFALLGPKWLNEVLYVLHHTTDDDVVNCKHIVLETCENNIIFLNLFLLVLHQIGKVSINILHINVRILVII